MEQEKIVNESESELVEQASKKTKPFSRYHDMLESWLNFNDRIINESVRCRVNPILERINFLAIADSNLDEFIRTKFKPNKGLKKKILIQTATMESVYDDLVSELSDKYKIRIVGISDLVNNHKAQKSINEIFVNDLYPLIQPMILKDELPIPDMQDGGFFLVSKLEEGFSGIIKMPESHLIKIKDGSDGLTFVRSEELIEHFVHKFYKGKTITWNKLFRVFRKIESLSVEENKKYLQTIKNELDARKKAEVVMVDISVSIDGLESVLGDAKKRKRKYPGGFGFLKDIRDIIDVDNDMVYSKAKPRIPAAFAGKSVFDIISKQDVLVHFPYESFDLSTVRLLQEAADDPKVKVIRQTLYRVSNDSPIIKALTRAAQQGKQVVVLLELKAKMDEEHNLQLVNILEKAGCNIIFGPIQMKTHAKVTLIIREEGGKLKKYCNISTGNFNDKTAKIYEDFSYFCKERNKFKVGEDLCDLFNTLGGCSEMGESNELLVAPTTFRSTIENEIRECIAAQIAHPEDAAEIKIKCNSFTDEKMTDLLYEASKVGVKVTLIVRGMCIVKTGIPDLSENIKCISIVGRYLEHSRVYEFIRRSRSRTDPTIFSVDASDIHKAIYIGSGDMMMRNLDYRVEVITPIRNKLIQEAIHNTLLDYQKDNYGSYHMRPDGTYDTPEIDKEDFKGDIFSVQNDRISRYKKIEKSLMKS